MMDTINNMLVCRRFTKYKHQWIHFTTNQLVYAFILLAACGNAIVPYSANASAIKPGDQIDCKAYSTCSRCTNETACGWSFEKQSCVDGSDRSFTPHFTGKTCPRFAVTVENMKIKKIKIKVVILEGKENFKTLLDKNKIKCEVDGTSTDATVENDNTIGCNYTVPETFLDMCPMDEGSRQNPLFIAYFSIVFGDDVRLKFDEVRDHYLAVYPCLLLSSGKTCSVLSNCTTASWDDGPAQYYCKWCLKNNMCAVPEQEGRCYARDTATGTPRRVENVVRVKGDDVRIEGFSPSEGPATGDTTLTVTVRGHRVLGGVYNTSVTVAGRECRTPATDGETITCTVTAAAVDVGPVVVTYRSAGPTEIVLETAAAKSFAFVRPRADDAACDAQPSLEQDQSFAGIASGGTRLTVRGRFECARDPRLYVVSTDGAKSYGDGCAAAADPTSLVCRAPNVTGVPADGLAVGLQWTFRGQTVDSIVPGGRYASRPDPVFTGFRVDGGGGPDRTVTIHGANVDGVSADDVTVRLAVPQPGDECVVRRVDEKSVTCVAASAPGGGPAADVNALVIAVGLRLNQTVELNRSDAVVQGDRPERLLAGAVVPVGIFSGFIVMLLAASLLVKAAVTRSRRQKKKWYMQQLRDITAGIDEEETL